MQDVGSRTRLAQLFRNARRAYKHAFATGGASVAWHAWYAAYLSPRLGELIPVPLSMDRLAAELVIVDRVYRDVRSILAWPEYYVEWFLQRYGAPKSRIAAI
jgi:hypothetical protein